MIVACDGNNSRSPLTYKSKPKAERSEQKQIVKDEEIIDEDTEDLFASAETVGDEELGDTRGAFMTSNGLLVNIGLNSRTFVNGALVDQFDYSTVDNAQPDFSGLQQMISISEEGTVSVQDLNDFGNLSSFLTIIQNSANNQLIQRLDVFNLDVSNLQNYRQQGLVPTLNFHSSF